MLRPWSLSAGSPQRRRICNWERRRRSSTSCNSSPPPPRLGTARSFAKGENNINPHTPIMNLHIYILVGGFQPLWKILVSWDDYSQYDGKNNKCSKPPISIYICCMYINYTIIFWCGHRKSWTVSKKLIQFIDPFIDVRKFYAPSVFMSGELPLTIIYSDSGYGDISLQ